VEPGETSIAKQRLGKQVSATTDTQAKLEELFGTKFSIPSVQSGYKEEFSRESEESRVEAGSNTSTVAQRVVGGDEKGTQCLEV
jgi:hypothetical protein